MPAWVGLRQDSLGQVVTSPPACPYLPIFRNARHGWHVAISSLRSYTQEKSQVHSHWLFQNTWMDEMRRGDPTQEVQEQQHHHVGPGPERRQVPKSTAPTPTHGTQTLEEASKTNLAAQ